MRSSFACVSAYAQRTHRFENFIRTFGDTLMRDVNDTTQNSQRIYSNNCIWSICIECFRWRRLSHIKNQNEIRMHSNSNGNLNDSS